MPSFKSFSQNTLIQRDDTRFISNIVDGEVILMNMKTGDYIALRATGQVIWDALEKPITIAALVAYLLEEYDVDENEAVTDTMGFLKSLLAQNMIKILTN